jgi:hypothetical protein
MKTGKNIILCSIFALAIGIATIVPLAFFMDTARAQTEEQWLDIDVPWAYFNADVTADNMHRIIGGIGFSTFPNYNLLTKNIDSRVDYVEIIIYTDELQLSKSHFYFVTTRPGFETLPPTKTADTDAWFEVPWIRDRYGIAPYGMSSQTYTNAIPNTGIPLSAITEISPEDLPEEWKDVAPNARHIDGKVGVHISNIDETTTAVLTALENAQTIFLDIRRVACITFADDGTVTTSDCDQMIQHIELTKNSKGEFTFGEMAGIEKLMAQMLQSQTESQRPAGIPSVSSSFYSSWG